MCFKLLFKLVNKNICLIDKAVDGVFGTKYLAVSVRQTPTTKKKVVLKVSHIKLWLLQQQQSLNVTHSFIFEDPAVQK